MAIFNLGTWDRTVDYLYDVRCDVVHEGVYYELSLPETRGGIPLLLPTSRQGIAVRAYGTADELRQIVLEGAVLGCLGSLP